MSSLSAISRGFILPDGTIAHKPCAQHVDIAMEYICNNNLHSEYQKSKYHDLCDFMVFQKGAIKVGCSIGSNPKIITYIQDRMTRDQWRWIEYYQSQGYKLDPI